MNRENLHTLIDRYEENYYVVNNEEHDEKFKWGAVQGFREVWFNPDVYGDLTFDKLFDKATKRCSLLINNRMVSPTTGIVKMAEQRPVEVERLFRKILFAPYGTVDELQMHVDNFLQETEKIRQDLFPRYYRYKQDRHAAFCYLSLHDPQKHYIYRYSEAEDFARYIEFGKDLGSGSNFSLTNYYDMADTVVEALKEHKSLLQKYEALLKGDPDYYYDPSLHLMAFDLMYCCRCYNLYHGLQHAAKKDSIRAYVKKELAEHEMAERLGKISEIEDEIHIIENRISEYREISLLGVEVRQSELGTGIVVAQQDENIRVRFTSGETSYIINKKYPRRPRFEEDEMIVNAFTELADLKQKKSQREKELARL